MSAPASAVALDKLVQVIEHHWGFRSLRPNQERAMLAVLAAADEPRGLTLTDLAPYRAALEGKGAAAGTAVAVTFRELWDDPGRYQGRRVRVEGRVGYGLLICCRARPHHALHVQRFQRRDHTQRSLSGRGGFRERNALRHDSQRRFVGIRHGVRTET